MTTESRRAAGRHEFVGGGALACGTTFPEDHGALASPRTVVEDGFEGRALAGRPVRKALGDVRARARTTHLSRADVRSRIEEHGEHRHLVDEPPRLGRQESRPPRWAGRRP